MGKNGKNGSGAPAGLPRTKNGRIDRSKLDVSLRDLSDRELEQLFADQTQVGGDDRQLAEGQDEENKYQPTAYLYVYEKVIENGVVQQDLNGKPLFQRRKGMENLSERILTSGSVQELTEYLEENDARLSQQEKQYLNARIDVLMEADEIEKAAKKALYEGEMPKKTEPTVDRNGILGLPGIVGEHQTSQNGCWSVSLSLMLKSRGVDLTQEQIRAYRPGFGGEGGVDANASTSLNMNADEFSSPYEHADLVLKVLPNTAMKTLHLNAVNEEQLTLSGRSLTPAERESARKQLRDVYGKTIVDTIRESIQTHKSPLSMSLDGHFVTVTGISADGKIIRYEDSLSGGKEYVSTRTMTVERLLDDYVFDKLGQDPQTGLPTVKKPGVGISLSWLQDIDPPAYDKRAEQPPVLLSEVPGALQTDESGAVQFDQSNGVTVFADGAGNGLLAGRTVSVDRKLDQSSLNGPLKGKRLELFNGAFTVGNVETYLPKQVYCKHDPKLRAFADAQIDTKRVRKAPGAIAKTLGQGAPRTQSAPAAPPDNAKAYIESLRREMKALPQTLREPLDLEGKKAVAKQEEIVLRIFAARVGLKTEIGMVRSLDKPRDKTAEREALNALADNPAMQDWLRDMPYDKLRSMILADHGGRMEKDFKKHLWGKLRIPENTPERFMPTAKQRCEMLKAAIEDRDFASRPEDERTAILTELLATRGAANVSRHTGENLGAKVNAAALEEKRRELEHPFMQRAIQKAAAEHPELLTRRGHGGAFELAVIDVYRSHCCKWTRERDGRYGLPEIVDPRYAPSYQTAIVNAQTNRKIDREDTMQRIAFCVVLRHEMARDKDGSTIRDPDMVNRLTRRLAEDESFREQCDRCGAPVDLDGMVQNRGVNLERQLGTDKVKALLDAERSRVLDERSGKLADAEKQVEKTKGLAPRL